MREDPGAGASREGPRTRGAPARLLRPSCAGAPAAGRPRVVPGGLPVAVGRPPARVLALPFLVALPLRPGREGPCVWHGIEPSSFLRPSAPWGTRRAAAAQA